MRRKCEVLVFCLSSFFQHLESSFRGGDVKALVQAVGDSSGVGSEGSLVCEWTLGEGPEI